MPFRLPSLNFSARLERMILVWANLQAFEPWRHRPFTFFLYLFIPCSRSDGRGPAFSRLRFCDATPQAVRALASAVLPSLRSKRTLMWALCNAPSPCSFPDWIWSRNGILWNLRCTSDRLQSLNAEEGPSARHELCRITRNPYSPGHINFREH